MPLKVTVTLKGRCIVQYENPAGPIWPSCSVRVWIFDFDVD